ncbi:hypothetical protein [Allokutzneria oryzae]|uniref:Uncharacterized protein n=1 Tax=Allokutzneria oryzae TaxID=1378989 RepID=A0ABV6A5F1_9PSEU
MSNDPQDKGQDQPTEKFQQPQPGPARPEQPAAQPQPQAQPQAQPEPQPQPQAQPEPQPQAAAAPMPPPPPAPKKQPKVVRAKAWVAGLVAAGLLLVGGVGGALIASVGGHGHGHYGKDRHNSRFEQRQDRFGDRGGPGQWGPYRGGQPGGPGGYSG